MAGKGTSYFTKKRREREAQFSNPWVWLKEDGDVARLRFLEEPGEGLFSGMFHRPYVKNRVQDPVVCVEQDDDYPSVEGMTEECPLCKAGDDPSQKIFVWVYVYYILHRYQNPALDDNSNAKKWTPVAVGKGANKKTMFKQDVDKVKILLGGPRLKEVLDDAVEAAAEANESLLASDYKYIRHGAPRDNETRYVFVTIPKSKTLKEEVTKAIDTLGDIADAAMEGTTVFYSSGAKVGALEEAPQPLEEEEEEEEEAEAQEETEVPEEADKDFANL